MANKKVWVGCLSVLAFIGMALLDAEAQTPPPAAAKPAAGAASGATSTPQARVDATPKGQLKNPYKDDNAAVVAAGKDVYFHSGCNGCHGGGSVA